MISCRNCIYFTIKENLFCYCKKRGKYLSRRLGSDFVGCEHIVEKGNGIVEKGKEIAEPNNTNTLSIWADWYKDIKGE